MTNSATGLATPVSPEARRGEPQLAKEVLWFEAQVREQMDQRAEGVVLHDNGEIVQVNEQASALLGCPQGELVGRKLGDFVPRTGLPKLQEWLALDHRVPLFTFA